jgi:prepilin-type N-terminal cleavage/methylation domain-containing protein
MAMAHRRPGVTLVELVVALTLFSLVATIMLTILREQQRFHTGALEIIDTRRSAHQAIDLLYGELRAISSADIYSISDSAITFRTTIGSSHLCAIDSGRVSIALPSTRTARVAALTTFLALPRAGDSVLVYDPGEVPEPDDDHWHPHVVLGDPGGGACPGRPHGLASNATEASGIAFQLAPPLAATVAVGSPLRFFRPASYSLYRGSGTTWMLGYSSCAAGTCTVRQPLSGPYRPFASGGGGGVAFAYFDAQGAPTSDGSRVSRIDVVARARSAAPLQVGHVRGQRYQDSLATTIALRNPS